MAPPRKYQSRQEIHINVESGIKDIGDFFGLVPSDVLKEGYLLLIDHHISRYGAPSEIKTKWIEITARETEEFRLKCERENEIKALAKKSLGSKDDVQNHSSEILVKMLSVLSPDEREWVIKSAKSDQINIVRAVLPRIRNLYETRTGSQAPYWTPADELTVLNQLIDLGAV